jgi:hypothetical protein
LTLISERWPGAKLVDRWPNLSVQLTAHARDRDAFDKPLKLRRAP